MFKILAGVAESRQSAVVLANIKSNGGALPSRRNEILKLPTWLCLLVVMFSSALNHSVAAADSFAKGLKAGRAGDFAQATKEFQSSLAAQPAAGTLLNLGLAHWRNGHVGEAILCWEQSAWLNPFEQDARNNLVFARAEMQVEPLELAWYELASTWLPANVWAAILCGSLWLAVGMMILPGVFRWRKARWHQAVAALGLGVFLLSLPPNLGVIARAQLGIALGKKSPLRLTPTQEAEVVSWLTPGEPVRQLRQWGEYRFVRTAHGSGWIHRREVGVFSGPLL